MKKTLPALILIVFAAVQSIRAQTFQKTYGHVDSSEYAWHVVSLPNGNAVVFAADFSQPQLLMLDGNGSIVWQKYYSVANASLGVFSMVEANSNGIMLGAYTYAADKESAVLIQIDSNGNVNWSMEYPGDSSIIANNVIKGSNGDYIFCGTSSPYLSIDSGSSGLIARVNSNGQVKWCKRFQYNLENVPWAYGTVENVVEGANGALIFAGDPIIKTTADGQTLWSKTYSVNSFNWSQTISTFNLIEKPNGNLAFMTTAFDSFGTIGFGMVETNSNGEVIRTKGFHFPNKDMYNYQFALSDNGGYDVLVSYVESTSPHNEDAVFLQIDSSFNPVSAISFNQPGIDWFNTFDKVSTGGFIFAGNARSSFSTNNDIFVARADAGYETGCNQGTVTIDTFSLNISDSSIALIYLDTTLAVVNRTVNVTPSNTPETTLCLTSAITVLDNTIEVSVFPNPASDELNINLSGLQAEQVSIYSLDGKLISNAKPVNNSIDISRLLRGVYVAEIKMMGEVRKVKWVKM